MLQKKPALSGTCVEAVAVPVLRMFGAHAAPLVLTAVIDVVEKSSAVSKMMPGAWSGREMYSARQNVLLVCVLIASTSELDVFSMSLDSEPAVLV